jgi:hypothetical protein
MKIKIKKLMIFSCLAIMSALSSCNEWLDVKPSDRLSEDMLFSTQKGYLNALTGVYMEMNNTSVYGRAMTSEFLDILAQYYYINSNKYLPYVNFLYTDVNVKASIESMWNKTFSLICNCNVIIDRCNEYGTQILTPQYYAIIKGEALGLRAMMHLDMLRLFGPTYSDNTKSQKTMPYVTVSDQSVQPILTAEEVMGKIIEDLIEASSLLKEYDPIITDGIMNSSDPNGNDLRYRQYRMNYYAVQALLVRAYMWEKNNIDALTTVTELVNDIESNSIFPFTSSSAIISTDNPDRIFSTEIIFSLYNSNRKTNIYDYNFTPALGDGSQILLKAGGTYSSGRVTALYDDANDYRFKSWGTTVLDGKEIVYSDKYKEPSTNSTFRYMVPLIRMSEMYLALAELTDDINTSNACINSIRSHRNCTSITSTSANLFANITSEFRREMIGEGQMFFYYKRNNVTTIPDGTSIAANNTRGISTTNFIMPLPDSETSTRTDN